MTQVPMGTTRKSSEAFTLLQADAYPDQMAPYCFFAYLMLLSRKIEAKRCGEVLCFVIDSPL
jgi:hypothetical protein